MPVRPSSILNRLKQMYHLISRLILSLLMLSLAMPSHAGGWADAILGGIAGAAEEYSRQIDQRMEMERQLEAQKKLLEYRYELERKRMEAEAAREAAREAQRQEQERLARIAAEKERKRALSTGTGFFVTPDGFIVTNHHVIEDKTHVVIRDANGNFHHAAVVAQDANRDLALLKVSGKFPSLKIARPDIVSKGQRVMTVGYPQVSIQGNESKVTDGVISSFSGFNNDQNWFQISTPIQGGNSGGPLVTEAGYVVGVVVATANATRYLKITGNIPQNVNYAIKSSVLLGFLAENNISNKGSFVGKISVDKVDLATVLVIAKGESIDLSISHQPHRNNEAGPKESDYESREENQSCTYSRQCKGDMNCFNGKCSHLRL